jgi:hypothetical protein
MRGHILAFLFGILVGGVGVGGTLVAAGDPYEYAVLTPYICERVKQDPSSLWFGETVPGQPDPCFVRYPHYPPWLLPHR